MPNAQLTYPDLLWAGNEHSLSLAIQAHAKLLAGSILQGGQTPEEEKPYNYDLQGSIGVISIKGPLVNTDSPYARYFGVTAYSAIRKALVFAATDHNARAIVLDIASGGGAVSGVADTADLVATINKDVKRVYAFTDATMASAAYWLGSSAQKVYNSKLAVVGSIGVIATHMEYSKALKDAGVGVTVVRAGKYKSLANSVEPLSDAAQKQIQDQLNAAYTVFVEHVAKARGVTFEVADQKMAQGREFFGEGAVDAGLSDGIQTFDSLLSRINAKLLDSKSGSPNNPSSFDRGLFPMKKALTEQDVAAIAAGAPVVPAVEVVVPAAAVAPAAEVTETEKEKATAAAPTAEEKPADQGGVVAFVQGQLAAAQADLLKLNIDLKAANDKIASMTTTHDALVKIAAQSVTNMKTALGFTGVDLSGMSAEALLAEHAASTASFTKAFKAGGVAAVKQPEAPGEAQLDPHYKARVAATRI